MWNLEEEFGIGIFMGKIANNTANTTYWPTLFFYKNQVK